MNKNSIAFFDSGVGGLTVYKEVKTILPNENYLYFGDTINMPYGEKTQKELIEITRKIFDFFQTQEVKAVVMACNTTSAMTYEVLKNDYDFKIYPIIQSVTKVISNFDIERLGVFATPATISSHAYSREINKRNPNIAVAEIATPDWVRIVEENRLDEAESIVKVREGMDKMLDFNPEKIILGCTHYPYLRSILNKFFEDKNLIDPSKYFAEFIYNDLRENNLLNFESEGRERFLVTSNPINFQLASRLFCHLTTPPELVIL